MNVDERTPSAGRARGAGDATAEPALDSIMRLPAVRTATGLSTTSIYQMMKEGRFPRAVQLRPRAVGWKRSAIQAFIAALDEVQTEGVQ